MKLTQALLASCMALSLAPFAQAATALPGKIQAQEFDRYYDSTSTHSGNCGSGPVDQQTTSDPQGGNCHVGWTTAGEWLEYDVSVATAGSYDLKLRLASANTGKFVAVIIDGAEIGQAESPASGWQSFQTVTIPNVHLAAGHYPIRIDMLTGGVNFNFFELELIQADGGTGGSPTDITNLKAVQSGCAVKLTWSDVAGETEYRVRRKLTGTTNYTNLTDVPANTVTYTDSSAQTGTSYTYMVRPVVDDVAVKISNTPAITLDCNTAPTGKPKVWIYSDMSDNTIPGTNNEGTVSDPDDISAMAGYLLMSNQFDTRGIVVASTHRSELKNVADQGHWADDYFGSAFAKDRPKLQQVLGGFPASFDFVESSIMRTAHHFQTTNNYSSLTGFATVQALVDEAESHNDDIYVLIWGSTTEPAILVKHLQTKAKNSVLSRLKFIAHWTNSPLHQGTASEPWKVANCNEDKNACDFMKAQAAAGKISYYELGAIGQHGIVNGSISGTSYNNQYRASALGTIFRDGKFAFNRIDHSDSATYWTLIGDYGVSLSDVHSDGSNNATIEQRNEDKFKAQAPDLMAELLDRVTIAAGQ